MSSRPTQIPTSITSQAAERVANAATDADIVVASDDLHEAAAQLELLDKASTCVQAWLDRLA